METKIISWENALEDDLVCDLMSYLEEDDVLTLFQGDLEELRINGECVLFIEIENDEKTRQTVVYLNSDRDVDKSEIVDRLSKFYVYGESMEYYEQIESTQENVDNLKDGIAYRGGAGYFYTLYKYIENEDK